MGESDSVPPQLRMFMRTTFQAGAPHLVGVADDVLRLRRAFEAVQHDDGEALGAHRLGLPVAVAEDLARDLIVGGGGDFDELGSWPERRVSARWR